MAVDALQLLIQPVGMFDNPAARLDDEPVTGFGSRHHIDGDTCLGRGRGDGVAGVALVHPHVGDGRRDPFRFPPQGRERSPTLHVSRGDDGGDHDVGAVDQHVPV